MELTLTSPPGRREGTSWVYQSWQRWVILFWHSSKTENYIWIYMDWWWTAKSIEIWYIYIYITVYILYITIYKWLNWAGWLILIPPHFPHSYLLFVVHRLSIRCSVMGWVEAWGTFGQMSWNWVLEHVFHADLSNWAYPILNSFIFCISGHNSW